MHEGYDGNRKLALGIVGRHFVNDYFALGYFRQNGWHQRASWPFLGCNLKSLFCPHLARRMGERIVGRGVIQPFQMDPPSSSIYT